MTGDQHQICIISDNENLKKPGRGLGRFPDENI
jgi:hypothetical protein